MPFSNYGPLIDPNAPQAVQALYKGTNPDFVFESPSPYNKVNKIKALMKIGTDVLILGVIAYSIMNNAKIRAIKWENIWSGILKDLKPTGDEQSIYYVFGGIILLISISFLVGIISTMKNLFSNDKFWYIGTPQNLIIFDNKKRSDVINWEEMQPITEFQSTPTGDTLTIKLKSHNSFLSVIQEKKGVLKGFNGIDIINPPNSMEVKRLIEKRIKEHANNPTNDDKELQELIELEKQNS
jgi:hypothetical protein